MSYDKVIEQLKNPAIKIDKLAQYAQGQNPAVPEFLALAEIKRRQSLVAHSPAPAQTTVQEDLTRSAMPQPMQQMGGLQAMQRPQGVAALPSGMGEQSYAGGGIVAFDDGGYVDEYAGGGIVAFAGDNGSYVDPMGMGIVPGADDASREDRDLFNRLKNYLNNLGGGVVPRGGAPVNATPAQVQAVRTGKNPAIVGSDADAQLGGFYGGKKPTDAQFANAHTNAAAPAAGPTQEQIYAMFEKRNAKEPATEKSEPSTPKEDMYAKYEEMLKGQAADSKAARDQDKYMRLLEAGLGIMGGTSQYALQNIGQGAMGAAKGYAQDKASYRKEDRENIKELMGLGMKREEAEREAQKLAMQEKYYASHGRYYDAAAKAAGVKAAGAGAGANTKLQIAQERNAVALYNKWLAGNQMATPDERKAAWLEAQQMAGGSGDAAAPAIMGTYNPKTNTYTPTGS